MRRAWSEDEDQKLIEFVGKKTLEQIFKEYFEGSRSRRAIATRIGLLKKEGKIVLESLPWTEEEDKLLEECYNTVSLNELREKFPNREIDEIHARAKKKFGFKRKQIQWTEAEDKKLRQYFEHGSEEDMCKMFPNRTYDSIRSHAGALGLKRPAGWYLWSEDEDDYLRKNIDKSDTVLAEDLKMRTENAIRKRKEELKNKRRRRRKKSENPAENESFDSLQNTKAINSTPHVVRESKHKNSTELNDQISLFNYNDEEENVRAGESGIKTTTVVETDPITEVKPASETEHTAETESELAAVAPESEPEPEHKAEPPVEVPVAKSAPELRSVEPEPAKEPSAVESEPEPDPISSKATNASRIERLKCIIHDLRDFFFSNSAASGSDR